MLRNATLILAAVGSFAVACGPTVIVLGEDSDSAGAGGGIGGASGAGAASGSGADLGSGAASGAGNGSGAGAGKPGPPRSAEAFGADGQHHLRGLASDAAGSVILTGTFDGTLDFGGGPLPAAGARSSYVAKRDAAGKAVWARALTASDCASTAVAVDAQGNAFVTGTVQGALALDGKAVTSGNGVFVVALDPAGQLAWAATYGTSAGMPPDRGLGVATTPAGGVVVSGSFHDSVDFGGGPLDGAAGSVFALALDPAGHHLWSRRFDGLKAFVAADAAGHVLVAANSAGGVMTAIDLDASGAPLWTQTYSTGSFAAVAADAAGDALFTGTATAVDFGGGALQNPLPNGEAFIVALDPGGHHRWSHSLPFDLHQSAGAALTLTTAGHVAVTGRYVHEASSAVIQSAFLVELDAAGVQVNSETFGPIDGVGDTVSQEGWGVAPAKAGALYLGGDFYGIIDVAGQTLMGQGSSDIFVARLE